MNGRAGAERRWEQETGKERESDRKKANSKRGLELRQRSQHSCPNDNPLGVGKGVEGPAGSQDLGSRPPCGQWAEGTQGVAKGSKGKDGSRPLDPCTLSSGH